MRSYRRCVMDRAGAAGLRHLAVLSILVAAPVSAQQPQATPAAAVEATDAAPDATTVTTAATDSQSPAPAQPAQSAKPPPSEQSAQGSAGQRDQQSAATPPVPKAATGTTPPPPPRYAQLPVPPAPDDEEGDWDPWENPEAGGRYHDGFFLRLSFGFGFGHVGGERALSTGDSIDFTGGSAGGSFAIGGTVVGALSLHVDFFFSRLLNPAVEGGRRGFDYGDPGLGAAGLGATYHFDSNVYVGVSGGLAAVNWERQTGESSESRAGFGGHAIVGKEWWVDPDWGVGLAAQTIVVSADDPYYRAVSVQAYHLLLSATYN